MEDEQQKHEILTNGPNNNNIGSPESPNLKTSNNINKEQDRFLPIANVGRIMKKVIPGNGKISKDAKETVQECVSEFISFVTGEASDKCQREKRKTINGDDIIWAITTLGFEDYVAPLKLYLSKCREIEGERLNTPKQQQRSSSSTTNAATTTSSSSDQHRLQHFQEMSQELNQENNNMVVAGMGPYSSATSVYSTTSTTPNSFVAMDHHHQQHHHHHQQQQQQPFPLPFSPNSIQKQLHQQDHLDSVENW